MATPTSAIPFLTLRSEDLAERLELEIRQQQEATPELSTCDSDDDSKQNFKWLREIKAYHFNPEEMEKYRMQIREPEYWKREADLYIAESQRRSKRGFCAEQLIAIAMRDALLVQGLSGQEVEYLRLGIDDQGYWKPEARKFEHIVALHQSGFMRDEELQARITPCGLRPRDKRFRTGKACRDEPHKMPRRSQRIRARFDASQKSGGSPRKAPRQRRPPQARR